ncbi:MAG: PEP-CTERM sorting domain-containing protein [Deltaproteobacteria bacterium]|nr:PEP-CTERM sorting domain-containing protein [Deltaproteobacteria bacterium]MBW2394815.1 PEP-CTERM sorting domain-containing protein [Deltaproteobacteria bacterium]
MTKGKTLVMVCALAMAFAVAGVSRATTIQINVGPSDVPDETQPRVNVGDAPTGFGPDSWQGPVSGTGNKTNWHARYNADGDALSILFPSDAAGMTIGDLADISYYTKRPTGTPAGQDWYILMYTRPTGSGDASSWYHDRFISNYGAHTAIDSWTQYSTGTGMTFHSNVGGGGPEMTLAQMITAHGTELVEMISIQTASNWNGFDGYIDGLEITLTNGNVGKVNFVPEPTTALLLGGGLVGLAMRRRRLH